MDTLMAQATPRERAGHSGEADGSGGGGGSGGRHGCDLDHFKAGISDGASELGGGNSSGVVEAACRSLELVFKPSRGHGDAALHFSQAQGVVRGQVDGAVEKQVISGGDGGGEGRAGKVGGEDGFKRVDCGQCGQTGGQDCTGLVAGGANRGFVFGQDGAGHDGDQGLDGGAGCGGVGLGQDLIADGGMLHVKGHHLAQAEAEHGEGFRLLGGKGIEVEDEDAGRGIGHDEGDGLLFGLRPGRGRIGQLQRRRREP